MEAGTLVGGRYRVLALIGAGGMARVYEVEHAELGRHFALKLLHPELVHQPAQVERFQQEARAVARLESAQIVGMVDCGVTEEGCPFLVMELLRGSDLRHLVALEGPLSAVRVIHIALDVCRGLAVAHGAGIVHRDLKPDNLFVTRDADGKEQCKLLDFGIAKLSEGNRTRPGALLGTVRYMAPEQLRPEQPVGPSTDLFALGVTLFECLAGCPPFEADTLERVLFKILNEPAPDLLALRPDLDPRLAELVMCLLAKDPKKRPASARSLGADLERCLTPGHRGASRTNAALEPTQGTSVVPVPIKPLRTRASRPAVLAAVVAALALCALGTWWATERRALAPSSVNAASTSPAVESVPRHERPNTSAPVPAPMAAVTTTTATATKTPAPTARVRSRPSAAPSAPNATQSEPDLPLFFPRSTKAP